MKGIVQTLIKIFAIAFYRSNATLFLLVLAFAGGFMRGSDHIMLAQYFVHELPLLAIPTFIWIAYALLIAGFNHKTASLDENLFLRNFLFISGRSQWIGCAAVAGIQLIPVHAYGLFLVAVAVKSGSPIMVIPITGMLVLITLASTSWLRNCLNKPSFQKDILRVWRWVAENIRRPFLLFPVEWAFRSQALVLAGYKLSGIALLWAALYLYETDVYDIRLAGIGVVFSFALNITFILAIHRFLHGVFPQYLQMPFSVSRRHALVTGMLLLFSAPEFVLLLKHLPYHLNFAETLIVAALGLSMNLTMFHFLSVRDRAAEYVMVFLYIFIITMFIAVLAGFPILLLAVACLATSVLLSWKYTYKFEYQAD